MVLFLIMVGLPTTQTMYQLCKLKWFLTQKMYGTLLKYSYLSIGWSIQSINCPIFISDEKELPIRNMAREPVMLNVYDMVGELIWP